MTDPVSKDGAKRAQDGRWLPGHVPPKSPGRPKLPEWFRDGAEDCLRVLLACATGRVQDGDPPAAVSVASESTTKDRIHAAELVCNRVLGKAPDVVEMSGDMAVGLIRRIVVDKGDADS